MRGMWHKVKIIYIYTKALFSQWAYDPQSLFSAASRDLVCKAGL